MGISTSEQYSYCNEYLQTPVLISFPTFGRSLGRGLLGNLEEGFASLFFFVCIRAYAHSCTGDRGQPGCHLCAPSTIFFSFFLSSFRIFSFILDNELESYKTPLLTVVGYYTIEWTQKLFFFSEKFLLFYQFPSDFVLK